MTNICTLCLTVLMPTEPAVVSLTAMALSVSKISKRFDVSLAAVREALSRLVACGLVW
jgi:DNA-binding IclR family transcriptional regulator